MVQFTRLCPLADVNSRGYLHATNKLGSNHASVAIIMASFDRVWFHGWYSAFKQEPL